MSCLLRLRLVDSQEQLEACERTISNFQRSTGTSFRLRVSLEINIGLCRGGFELSNIDAALGFLGTSVGLTLSGFMGYEGHVPFTPRIPLGPGQSDELSKSTKLYSAFVARLPVSDPELCFNTAGSRTLPLYQQTHRPANDFTVGSALVKPFDFDCPALDAMRPALFIGAPLIKRIQVPVPFLPRLVWSLYCLWNPTYSESLYLLNAGLPVHPFSPTGLKLNPILPSHPGLALNLLPTQALYHAFKSNLGLGDYVFLRPSEGDAMLCFSTLHLIRGGSLLALAGDPKAWSTFRGGLS